MNSSFFGFFAHAGFLEGIYRAGLRPTAVGGASAGAIISGFYAAGFHPDDISRMVFDPGLRSAFYEWGLPVRAAGLVANRPDYTGVLNGRKGVKLLKSWLGDQRIEDCDPRLSISAANMSAVETRLLESGPLVESILASCAVPGMFMTQAVDGHQYWDGGIADPVPFEQWCDDPEIDTILVHMAVNTAELEARAKQNGLRLQAGLGRAFHIITDEFLRLKLKIAKLHKKEVIIMRTVTPRPSPFRLKVGHRCLELGLETAEKNSAELQALL